MNSSTIRALDDIDGFLRQAASYSMDLRGRYRDGIKKAMQLVRNKIQSARGNIREDVYKELLVSIELIENGVKRRDFLDPRHPETWSGYTEDVHPGDFTEAGGVAYNYLCMTSSIIYSLLYDYDKLADFKRSSRELLFKYAAKASNEQEIVRLAPCRVSDLPDLYKGAFEAYMAKHPRGKAFVRICKIGDEPIFGLTYEQQILRNIRDKIQPACAVVEIDGNYMKGDVSFLYFTIPQTETSEDSEDAWLHS